MEGAGPEKPNLMDRLTKYYSFLRNQGALHQADQPFGLGV